MSRMPVGAFTLTELLVCICIIATLVALVSAVSGPVLARARTQICISHLKSIGFATLSYAWDHDTSLPPSIVYYESYQATWMDLLTDYGIGGTWTQDKVWYCPETDVNTPDRVSWGCPSYGANDLLFSVGSSSARQPDGSGPGIALTRLTQIKNPGATMMIWDNGAPSHPLWGHWQGVGLRWVDFQWPPTNDNGYYQGQPALRHYGSKGKNSAFVTVFCDGHAEAISEGDPRVQSASDRTTLVTP